MKPEIRIDIVSDVACPWCYVGKKNLENALPQLEEYNISINWHPYQLDPNIPKKGVNRDQYLQNKFGSAERYKQLSDHLHNAGKKAGIDFNHIKKAPNTLVLHQLLHVASEEGFGNDLKEAFFRSYFVDGRDMTSLDVLIEILSEFGWKPEKTKLLIENEDLANEVKSRIRQSQEMGVRGVPYFIFNQKYAFSGAQPTDVFVKVINDVAKEKHV